MPEEPDEDPLHVRPRPRPGRKVTFLEILAVVLTVAFWAVRADLPFEADGIVSVVLVLVSVFVVAVTIWRSAARTPRHPALLTVHWVLVVVLVAGTALYLRSPGQFLGRGQCDFGIDGYGPPGPVWVKLVNGDRNVDHVFTVDLLWGAKRATVPVPLAADDSIYLTMSKGDFHSPPMDVTVTPLQEALLTCGNGTPPARADSRAVVGTDWHH